MVFMLSTASFVVIFSVLSCEYPLNRVKYAYLQDFAPQRAYHTLQNL
jgi:hypothetical protein